MLKAVGSDVAIDGGYVLLIGLTSRLVGEQEVVRIRL
jgi:hypothetical protein